MGEIRLANKRIYTFFVENPISGDDIPLYRVPRDTLVQEIVAVRRGGVGTFGWELRFDPDSVNTGGGTLLHSGAAVGSTTGVIYSPPFTYAPGLIPAGDWVWLELLAVSTGLSRPVAALVQMVAIEQGP